MMQRNRIAVTGGIGSGKTAVLRLLEEWGYPVFSCDEISRGLWREEDYLLTLAEAFPNCTEKGRIDKAKLTALVFSDPKERKRLEDIAHPRIMRALLAATEGLPICFAEVPLLFEGGFEALFDGILLIERREEKRVAAVAKRDAVTEASVRSRIAAQFDDARREKGGAVVIENNGTIEELAARVRSALRSLGLPIG